MANSKRLAPVVRDVSEDQVNDVFFSAAGIRKIAFEIGRSTSKALTDAEYEITQRRGSVAELVADLPLLHQDPFDRLLIAQAMASPMRLYTADSKLQPYSDLVTLIT